VSSPLTQEACPRPPLSNSQSEDQGDLHLRNSGLDFRKFLVTNGTAFSGFFEKEENLTSYSEISEISILAGNFRSI